MQLDEKVTLIQQNMWKMPVFHRGILLSVGDESISYEPSRLIFNAGDYKSPADFLANSMTGDIFDPFVIQECLISWGQEYLDAVAKYVND